MEAEAESEPASSPAEAEHSIATQKLDPSQYRCTTCHWRRGGQIFGCRNRHPRLESIRYVDLKLTGSECPCCKAIIECVEIFGNFHQEGKIRLRQYPCRYPQDSAPKRVLFEDLYVDKPGYDMPVEESERDEMVHYDRRNMQFFTLTAEPNAPDEVPKLRLASGDTSSAEALQ
jgi:hypothetical protein